MGTFGSPVSEIIDPVFAKTSPKRSFCMTENEHFGHVFKKTGSINSGTGSEFALSTRIRIRSTGGNKKWWEGAGTYASSNGSLN